MSTIEFHPLSLERWPDFEQLFGPRGACAGCWCMYWKQTGKEFDAGKGEPNHFSMQARLARGEVPGLLAYVDGVPAGWIAVEPRRAYPRLARSRVLAPLDHEPVWSVPCFFVAKNFRRRGLSVALLKAAIEHVARQGGSILEGYPVEPADGQAPPVFIYTGVPSAFRQAGFREVARRSPTRPIMRFVIE
jgi:GNAT superfamily N-acetyltransferase